MITNNSKEKKKENIVQFSWLDIIKIDTNAGKIRKSRSLGTQSENF